MNATFFNLPLTSWALLSGHVQITLRDLYPPCNTGWILNTGGGELRQPCNAPLICHAIGTDQIIDLDLICSTLWAGFFFSLPSWRLLAAGTRRTGKVEREGRSWWGSGIRPADVDSSGSAGPLGRLSLFIVHTVHLMSHFFSSLFLAHVNTTLMFAFKVRSSWLFCTVEFNKHTCTSGYSATAVVEGLFECNQI